MRLVFAMLLAPSLLLGGCNKSESAYNTSAQVGDGNEADPGAMIFCAEVQKRTTQADCDDLTEMAGAAKRGTAAFNVPTMERGKTAPIQLVISLDPRSTWEKPPEDAMNAADNAVANATDGVSNGTDNSAGNASTGPTPPSPRPTPVPTGPDEHSDNPANVVDAMPGPTEQYEPLTGRHMRAELTGHGFKIEAKSPMSQDLARGSVTSWEWDVTPLRASDYTLTIKTAVEGVMADGQRLPLRSTIETRQVAVTIHWYQKFMDQVIDAPVWIKAITTLLGSLAALATAWWVFVRAARGKSPPPPPPGQGKT